MKNILNGVMMNKIGIIGNGFVGNAIHQEFKKHFQVFCYDKDKTKSLCTHEEVSKCDLIFLCVPTPMTEIGEFDVSILNSTMTKLPPGKIVIIKSTITPASAEDLVESFPEQNLIFNPEFLTERTAVKDFQNPSRIVIGGNNKDTVRVVEKIYRTVFPCRLLEIVKTDAKTACFIKYFSNCFFAAKVSLINEFKQIADVHSIKWETAMKGFLLSGWVNPMHTQVPGHDGQLGFGGKCFPKDINAFIKYAEDLGIDPKILKASWEKNLEVRKKLDWHDIEGAVTKKELKNERS